MRPWIKPLLVLWVAISFTLSTSLFSNTQAGDLEPSADPAPTMRTLDEIYDAAASNVSERQGYTQSHIVPGGGASASPVPLFMVPAGQAFVLLKLHVMYEGSTGGYAYNWQMKKGETLFIHGQTIHATAEGQSLTASLWQHFPDRCAVVAGGETLSAVNRNASAALVFTIVGYFYDVNGT